MRFSSGHSLGRAIACACALLSLWAPAATTATAAPPAPSAAQAAPAPAFVPEQWRVPFAERYRALRHGGIVRAAGTAVTCSGGPAHTPGGGRACLDARAGGEGANGDFDMTYVDVDDDPNTYNSSRAELGLPPGAYVRYARLYWGGNLRVGEQKPPADNGRVLVAEPGGHYKELSADTVVGHRATDGADAYQASADVTGLVRSSGSGAYTVAQINVAKGRSAAGSWGGWTLVVAYEKASEPLRHLALWDGFEALAPGTRALVRMHRLPFAPGAHGLVGLVAYNGDRGRTGDSLSVSAGEGARTVLSDSANPPTDVLNSTIAGPDGSSEEMTGSPGLAGPYRPTSSPSGPGPRRSGPVNTLGYDSDVLDLGDATRNGGDRLDFQIVSQRDAAWAGVLFTAVDAQQ
ncbi:DUF3344 domain-containing protein [Streptomyces sp. B3I8]|uniref:DUF3344 domain-containing protein n=1 Tax=Streptomyces sp. B3I8 TaxID=3042303 RepID=UPI002781A3A7|nr:DUF3344 domain-containing protein [Streptomyces sp. B3I8]MDQ0787056.1 hypothetical protein [Streptomyces sp. B3I8]